MQLYMDIDGVIFSISVTGYIPGDPEDLKVKITAFDYPNMQFEKVCFLQDTRELSDLLNICKCEDHKNESTGKHLMAFLEEMGVTAFYKPEEERVLLDIRSNSEKSLVSGSLFVSLTIKYIVSLRMFLECIINGLDFDEALFYIDELVPGCGLARDEIDAKNGKELSEWNPVKFAWPFPVCSHEGRGSNCNHGYSQGVMMENIPYEIELVETPSQKYVSIIFSREYVYYDEDDFEARVDTEPMDIGNSILLSDLTFDGYIDDTDYRESNLNALWDAGIVLLEDPEVRPEKYVEWYTDANGSLLTRVIVVLEKENKVFARTDLEFDSISEEVD